jgi:hypothetical protein
MPKSKTPITPTPDPNNANRGTKAGQHLLNRSIATHGFGRSILVDKHGTIIAGNKTYDQAKALGHDTVTVIPTTGTELIAIQRTDLDLDTDPAARELAYADNRIAELNLHWDTTTLETDFANPDLPLDLYFDPATLDFPDAPPDLPDDLPPSNHAQFAAHLHTAAAALTLSLHDIVTFPDGSKLIVGDAATPDPYALLDLPPLGGIFTSPPYAEQRAADYPSIPEAAYVPWFATVQSHFPTLLAPDASFFLNLQAHSSHGTRSLYVYDLILDLCRTHHWRLIDEFAWIRTSLPHLSPHATTFKNGFEPIFHLAQSPSITFFPWTVAHASNGAGFSGRAPRHTHTPDAPSDLSKNNPGLALPSNVLTIHHELDPTSHPARFPIALPSFFLAAFSPPSTPWLDPFVGSGSTLLACRHASRQGFGIDLVPHSIAEATLWIAHTCHDPTFLINSTEYTTSDLLPEVSP